MKKLFAFVTALMMAGASWAASETPQKWLREIVYNDTCRVLSYSDDGMLTSIFERSSKMDSLQWHYEYYKYNSTGERYLYQGSCIDPGEVVYYFNRAETYFRSSDLNAEGLIKHDSNGNSYYWSTGEDFDYLYKEDRMVEMSNVDLKICLTWTDGNVTDIAYMYGDTEAARITCTYTDLPAKGVCQAFNSPLMLLLDYYNVQSLGPLWHGYYGQLSKNLLDEMTITFSDQFYNDHAIFLVYNEFLDENWYPNRTRYDSSYYPITKRKSRKYSYETDADGYVTSMTVNEGGRKKEYAMHYVDARPDDQQTPDDYHPLLKDGKKWNYKVTCDHFTNGGISSVETFDYQEQINGDTLIDGRKYYILEAFNPDKRLPHRRYWREEGRKVYCWDVEKKLDLLMYTFDATIGYRVLSTEPVFRDYIVTGKGTVNTQGNHLSFYQLRGYSVGIFSWIEGVGSTGLLSEAYGRSRIDTVRVRVQSCYEDGKCIFNAEDMQEGDFTDNLKESAPQFSARQSTYPSASYDLQGRRLTTQPRRGIYVKDGKKVVVK